MIGAAFFGGFVITRACSTMGVFAGSAALRSNTPFKVRRHAFHSIVISIVFDVRDPSRAKYLPGGVSRIKIASLYFSANDSPGLSIRLVAGIPSRGGRLE